MIGKINVKVMGEQREIPMGLTFDDLANQYEKACKYPILLAKVGNEYKELNEMISEGDDILFVDLKDSRANKVYVNALILLMTYVVEQLYGHTARIEIKYSIDKGIYIETNFSLNANKLNAIKKMMLEVANQNMSITKCYIDKDEAIEYFNLRKDKTKVNSLKYETSSYLTLYKLGGIYDYFYGLMPVSTEVLKNFDLTYLNDRGFVLLFPTIYIDGIKPYEHRPKLFDVFNEYDKWASTLKIGSVPDLNQVVSDGRVDDIIRIMEMIQSNTLFNIARDIVSKKNNVKIILIAGPSSSGKTTTCRKLSMYLRSFGMFPKEISMDDYFVDREKTPKDENGEYDYECLEALDVKAFDNDMKNLLDGKKVKVPKYNFVTGMSEPGREEIHLGRNDILIIEGIHALSDRILNNIDRKQEFKIYLSPLTILNIDSHNRISLTDNRLLRRIVRDNRTRGHNVEDTLTIWKKVRLGEEKHIFPNQEAADVVFNTSLIYEIGILKTYVEPLLYSVSSESPEYETALRLINMLKTFLPIPSEAVPSDSLLREFIGGSCFK